MLSAATPVEPFESSVILEGSKTSARTQCKGGRFESSVILEGSKTVVVVFLLRFRFESSVILEGSKTYLPKCKSL